MRDKNYETIVHVNSITDTDADLNKILYIIDKINIITQAIPLAINIENRVYNCGLSEKDYRYITKIDINHIMLKGIYPSFCINTQKLMSFKLDTESPTPKQIADAIFSSNISFITNEFNGVPNICNNEYNGYDFLGVVRFEIEHDLSKMSLFGYLDNTRVFNMVLKLDDIYDNIYHAIMNKLLVNKRLRRAFTAINDLKYISKTMQSVMKCTYDSGDTNVTKVYNTTIKIKNKELLKYLGL